MKTISVNLPEAFVNGLESLVQRGLYANRSEAIRVSVRDLLKRELMELVAVPGGKYSVPSPFFSTLPPPRVNFGKGGAIPQADRANNLLASKISFPFFLLEVII